MTPPVIRPTRSEAVRQRRDQENAQRQNTVSVRVRRESPLEETPKPRKPAQKPTRRYQSAAMAIPQVRPQAPSLPSLRPGWRLLSGSLIVLFAAAIYMLWTSPFFQPTGASVRGNQRIPAEEIDAALGLKAGVPVFLVAPELLEAHLLRVFPDLASATVKVGLPARVTVSLRERQPAVIWVENNTMTWLDADGFAFMPRGEMPGLVTVAASARPPQVQPDAQGRFLPLELVRAFLTMSPHVPPGTAILYDPQYGLGWNDARGWRAYFGSSTEDLTLKLRIYETLVNSLTQRGIQPVLISVAYPNAPFYRLEP